MRQPDPSPSASTPGKAHVRAPLAVRKRRARQEAAARIAARTTRPLGDAQRARDPLARAGGGPARKWIRILAAALASLAVHAGVVLFGFLTSGQGRGQREVLEQKIAIEVRQPPPPEPPKLAIPDKPEAPPSPPKLAKAPPPKARPVTPEPPAKTPPPRVVGLSLESTSEGGEGPGFAVGNTRMGATAERATSPDAVPKEAPGSTGEPAPGENKVATHLPSSGVKYTAPVRRRQPKLPYPETLKAQGIEADVKVSLAIDATGKVTAVKILTPAAYPEFNDEARKMGFTEDFEPALRDGIPIPYSLPFTYRFRLQDE